MDNSKKRKFELITIENQNNNRIPKKIKKRNKYSKSQQNFKLLPKELINNFFEKNFEAEDFNYSLNTSENNQTKKIINTDRNRNYHLNNSQNYKEKIIYNLDTNTKDTSNFRRDNEEIDRNMTDLNLLIDYKNNSNIQKNYLLEEKNKYIQELENQVKSQENIIDDLLKYKSMNKFDDNNIKITKINNLNKASINQSNFNSLDVEKNYDFNKKLIKKLNKEDIQNETNINKFYNNFNFDNDINNKMRNNNGNDKYNLLYSKYLQLSNDFKFLSNNNSLIEINQIKNKYEKLKEENKLLTEQIEEKDKIIEKQNDMINNLKNNIDKSNEEPNKIIKNLNQKNDELRKELLLSQNMINSLKTEITQLNEIKEKSNNNNNTLNRNNTVSQYIFQYNDKENIPLNPQSQTYQNINYNELINNTDSPVNMKMSLNNTNKLLSSVLAENNQLRNKLKKYGCLMPVFDVSNSPEDNDETLKINNLKQFEEKFKYFNEYIKKIKIYIKKIYKDIPFIFKKYTNANEKQILSNEFIFDLYELRKEYNDIEKIDAYNLDSTDDEKCIKIYRKIMKILNEEFEQLMKIKNNDFNSKKINYDEINKIIERNKNNQNQYNDNDLLIKEKKNKSNINITDNKNIKTRNIMNSFKTSNYNFDYGRDSDDIKPLRNNYGTICNTKI